MQDLKDTLKERGANYGAFTGHAAIAQSIKAVMHEAFAKNHRFAMLSPAQKAVIMEGVDMIAHKLGRIGNGDPTFNDSWVDIAGYATITEKFVNEGTE